MNMIDRETLPRWRAAAGQWAHFIKPSLLVAQTDGAAGAVLLIPELNGLPTASDCALVVDLPGTASVACGVALARMGWAVIPMFNTTSGTAEIRSTAGLVHSLRTAARELPEITSGPPAFLIDSERQTLGKPALADGDFDNRWFVFESDFPSDALLSANGIKRMRVMTRETTIGADLRDALSSFQGIDRAIVDPDFRKETSFPSPRSRPVRFISSLARCMERNPNGTFGRRHAVSHG
jgi:hypothetical protein